MPEDQPRGGRKAAEKGRNLALPLWARLMLAVALTAALVWYLDPMSILTRIRTMKPSFVGAACCILAAQYAMAAFRWHFVLRLHGIEQSSVRIQAIYGAGALANLAGLTAVAGMSVRGILLLRAGVPASRVLGVLFVERFSAMAGFGLCFLAGLAAAFPLLQDELARLRLPEYAGLTLATGMAAAAVLALLLARRRFVRKLLGELRETFLSTGAILSLAVLSCVIVWLGFAAVAVLAYGMDLDVNPLFFLVVMPVVAFLAALPVTLGGWGVREGSMVAGLLLFGIPADAGAALSIAYGALGMAVTLLLGGASALMLGADRAKRTDAGPTDPMT